MQKHKRICLYHNDGDGYASGALVAHHHNWDVELIKYNYGWDFPWDKIDKDTEVFMVDVSLQTLEEMYDLQSKCKRLVWIDHEDIVNLYWLKRPMMGDIEGPMRNVDGLAACERVWLFLQDEQNTPIATKPPKAIYYLGRYDMWDHKDPSVLPFQFGLRAVNSDPGHEDGRALWSVLLSGVETLRTMMETNILNVGVPTHNYFKENNRKIAGGSFMTELEGVPIVACNAGGNSMLFNSVLDRFPEAKAGCLFFYTNGAWVVSLYSIGDRKHPPLGQIATKLGKDKYHGGGGGGRDGAAGFRWHDTLPPFPIEITALEVKDEQGS